MKKCSKCNRYKPKNLFHKGKNYKDGLVCWCHSCRKEYYQQNKEKIRVGDRIRNLKVKSKVMEHYGGECICCGETILAFLTIDHIVGNGNKHKKEIGVSSGKDFYYWLIKNNFPGGFQVLCFNCNCGRQVNSGICPHKEGRSK